MKITNIFYTFIMSIAYIYIDNNIYVYADSFNSKNKNIEKLKCPPNNEIKLYNSFFLYSYFNSENIEEKELYKKKLLYNKLNNFGCTLKDYEKYLQIIEKKEKILNEDLLNLTQEIDLLFYKYKQKILKININNNLNNNSIFICLCWIIFQIFCFICGIQKIFEFIFMPPFNNEKINID